MNATKSQSPTASKVAATATPAAATAPVASTAPATTAEPKKIDLNKPTIKEAIAKGKAIIKEGKTKADAAMAIYEALKDESKEVIAAAFVEGATLTEKGAITYVYNCKRKAKKAAKTA